VTLTFDNKMRNGQAGMQRMREMPSPRHLRIEHPSSSQAEPENAYNSTVPHRLMIITQHLTAMK